MNPVTKRRIKQAFGAQGLLSKSIPGYLPRTVQLEMALAVGQALDNEELLIAEAGTGTGKTYAYLIPSLLSGKKVIIATGTKNLQDQLFHRDIPVIRKALALPLKVAILKGRSNYICLHRTNTYLESDFVSTENARTIYAVQRWAQTSEEGEIEHCDVIKPDSSLLPYVTSSTDNCLGQDCEFFTKCFLFKARDKAEAADVVIINHHLFFADSQLRRSGISEILPDSDAVIFDEAHQLPDIAMHFLGESISGRQLIYLARDIQAELQKEAQDLQILQLAAEHLINATKKLQESFGFNTKGSFENIIYKPELQKAIASISQQLLDLQKITEVASIRGRGLENCWRRTLDLSQRFARLTIPAPQDQIHWYEVQENNFTLHHTPINVADYFNDLIHQEPKAWIFTSATLSVNQDFRHFESHLGLSGATKLYLESPFDYKKQALLYLPSIQATPSDDDYTATIVETIIPVLNLTQGRAFFLFTSHKALKEAAYLLAQKISFPLLIQGDQPKRYLLDKFCQLENAVLLGASSFWEGVDVKGDLLSCVIIDKIPFLAPDDPILRTRLDIYKKQGKNAFLDYQLPQAVISLRQGVGRLIRDVSDKGILVLCDPRLISKDYGQVFLDSLPAMPTTQSFNKVRHFFESETV